jgi:hypothetical protein
MKFFQNIKMFMSTRIKEPSKQLLTAYISIEATSVNDNYQSCYEDNLR